jgi:hypothetical protein
LAALSHLFPFIPIIGCALPFIPILFPLLAAVFSQLHPFSQTLQDNIMSGARPRLALTPFFESQKCPSAKVDFQLYYCNNFANTWNETLQRVSIDGDDQYASGRGLGLGRNAFFPFFTGR